MLIVSSDMIVKIRVSYLLVFQSNSSRYEHLYERGQKTLSLHICFQKKRHIGVILEVEFVE